MKQRILIVICVILLTIATPLTVFASSPRILIANPRLTFTNMTANCGVNITADSNDKIAVEIKLWKGTTCVATWTESSESYLLFSDTVTVNSKGDYTLTVDYTINSILQPQLSVTSTCK